MKAKEIMTSPVISVAPDATVREIAALMLEMRVSAVPVLEADRLVGIVSEANLLHRHEIGTDGGERRSTWWLGLFDAGSSAAEYVKSHAGKARDVMTRKVVTIPEDMPLAQIATLLEKHGIKRVPVMRGERLVGIVSRADLVKALASTANAAARPTRDDAAIHRRLVAELERQPWWRSLHTQVTVTDGVVHYWGATEPGADRDAARVAAENVPGVRGVEDHRIAVYEIPSML